ncbi:uncharacterized protein LOC128216793 isoform X2 [Mya arenaria]|uniref:uncharacterized protein LOC128216793 isoform X2 n=1 Tax=Mya arenaria TaxID=6604 RepID=UPI0022E5E024|nr:uncharacterized protein LOC128216793 isoform X2 [Mya arenaria]
MVKFSNSLWISLLYCNFNISTTMAIPSATYWCYQMDGGTSGQDDRATSYGDHRTRESSCQKCKDYKEELRAHEKTTHELNAACKTYLDTIEHLDVKNEKLKEASEILTRKMACVLEGSDKLERLDDKFSNTKLAQHFDGDIKKLWEDLNEAIVDDDQTISEVHRLHMVSEIMKDVYKRCKDRADQHIRQFCFLGEKESLPNRAENTDISSNEFAAILKCRRIYGQKESVLATVKQTITDAVLDGQASKRITTCEKMSANTKHMLTKFIEDVSECCWLMVISKPSLCLNFNVVGQKYENLENRFVAIATEENVTSSKHPEGSVHMVVWPSVELEESKTGFMVKGEVILVSDKTSTPDTE